MADHDAFAAVQAENSRLIGLLEPHGIDWRLPPEPVPVVTIEAAGLRAW